MKRILTVLFLFAAAVSFTGSAYAVKPAGALSKKELKTLIATAKTPAQHTKLANYYRYEANEFQARAKEHEEMGADYDKNPALHPVPKGQTLGDHCRNLMRYYSDAAKTATEMAAMHEEMAKAAR
jgi:hypothetical protein